MQIVAQQVETLNIQLAANWGSIDGLVSVDAKSEPLEGVLVENLGIWKIPAGWKDSIAFAILIIFLLLRPGGIWGVKTEKEQL